MTARRTDIGYPGKKRKKMYHRFIIMLICYDVLVLCTGSSPTMLPIPVHELSMKRLPR